MNIQVQPPTAPPILNGVDPYARETVANPYDFHRQLRDTASIVTLDRYGVYATGRYDVIRQILENWQDFSSAGGSGIQDIRKPGIFRIPSKLVDADPPDHTEVRSAMTKILSPKRIRGWRDLFEKEARSVVDKILDMKTFDGMEDFVDAYLLKVFPQAVGIELPRNAVHAIGEMRFNQSGPPNDLYENAMRQAQPYLDWYEHSVDRIGALPGSIAEEIYWAEDRGEIQEGVAKSLVRTFVGGGTDSTIAGIGACMFHLASSPDQMAIAVAEPEIMKTALDEAIRMESPFQIIYRTPNSDMEFAGFQLEKDRKLGLWLGAGNRDPRKWEYPDKFDLRRRSAGVHIALGTGMHVCIGQMLARLEAECLLVEFARRVKTLELIGDPEARPMNQMRALRRLPLRVAAH